MEDFMSIYKMHGTDLYNARNRKIAITKGKDIYDTSNRRVATIRGNNLYDSNEKKMMTVRGLDIYDAGNARVASLSDAGESIEGVLTGMVRTALWYCFIR